MIKRNIKETINEYDDNGHLVRQTVTETTEDDDTPYIPAIYAPPNWWNYGSTCECNTTSKE